MEKAEAFRALHHTNRLFVLPNAWDVATARLFEDAGFPAVATSSAAVAVSVGYPDGERIPRNELLAVVRRMAAAIRVPLSVDFESGYGATVRELEDSIRRLIDAGAVGLNLEDSSRVAGRALIPVEDQVERLKTVRRVADSMGIPLVINARTDAFIASQDDAKARLEETLRRARAYQATDPDCLYPMGLAEREAIAAFVRGVTKPVNVMVRRGLPTVPELERLGVRRLSLGPAAMYATMGLLKRVGAELKERGSYDSLMDGAISFDELMSLGAPRP